MRLLSLALLMSAVSATAVSAQTLRICDDEAGWPPYIYNPIENGAQNKDKIEGAAVEFMAAVFADAGIDHTIELLPWKRCLGEVADYSSEGDFEAFSNGSYNEERLETYHITKPIYETNSGMFYSPANHPDGLNITSVADAKNYEMCGVFGYNYENWNLGEDDIDTSAKSTDLALKKVAAGRCDAVPSAIEPVVGSAAIGKPIVPEGMKAQTFDFMDDTTFHIYIAKTSPRAEELRDKINASIDKLRGDGTHDEIFEKYLTF